MVWRMDRLARSLKQLIQTVEILEAQGVGFRSITENIDTTNAGGKLIFHIFGALAEFEWCMIKERTIAGLESARARGRIGGRPKIMDENDIKMAKTLLKDPNITINQVAKRMGVSEATLFRRVGRGLEL